MCGFLGDRDIVSDGAFHVVTYFVCVRHTVAGKTVKGCAEKLSSGFC